MQLVSEMRAYIAIRLVPIMAEQYKKTREFDALMAGVRTPEERTQIWLKNSYDFEPQNQFKNEMNQKFGGQVRYVVGEYKRLGMLPPSRTPENRGEPNAQDILLTFDSPWAHDAANQLEALARRL